MNKYTIFMLVVLLITTACSLDDTEETKNVLELDIPEGFEFSMEEEVNLTIELKASDYDPVEGITYYVSYVNEEGSNNFITKLVTDENGLIEKNLTVPTYVSELFISGFMNSITLEIEDNTASYYFGPTDQPGNREFVPRTLSRDFTTLDWLQYNVQGVPYPHDMYQVTAEMLERIDTSLPESQDLAITHPQYLQQGITTNMVIEDSSDVWLTFITEGAGYLNGLGFYTYDAEEGPPEDASELEHILVFPNSSLLGDGGGLTPGMRVYLGQYGAGTVMGWFLVQNGWVTGDVVDTNAQRYYSNPEYNPEPEEYSQHSVFLYDAESELFLLAFDDQPRPDGADNDFNDAVFFATANPIENINTDNIPPIDIPEDDDEDGVNNPFDDYPDDPERAFNTYYPSEEEFSSLVYEDKWPAYGDYDMNDMVMDYQYMFVMNADDEIKDFQVNMRLRAAGAGYDNGFSILLPFEYSNLTDAEFSSNIAPGLVAEENYTILDLFSSTKNLTGVTEGFFNTEEDDTYYEPVSLYYKATLTDPQELDDLDFGLPFNPFILRSGNTSHEIHLINKPATTRMNFELFQTGDDASDVEGGEWFVSPENLPWALNLPESWKYPSEKNAITETYYNFADWAESGGTSNQNWYIYGNDNADEGKVYLTP